MYTLNSVMTVKVVAGLGRLVQGIRITTGNDGIDFISHELVQIIDYADMVCDYRQLKTEK